MCNHWQACKDPNKNHDYRCTRFSLKEVKDLRWTNLTSETEKTVGRVNYAERDFDIESYIERALESSQAVPADIRLNDQDIPRAPNFFKFATGKQFLNIKPYAKQLEIGIHYYQEYCPRCSDKKYVNNIPVDATPDQIRERIVLLKWERCPQCKVTKSELVLSGELTDFYEFAVNAGQRGGKSAVTGMCAAYTTHQWLKLNNPTRTFDLLPNSVLQGTFVALNKTQVKETLWLPFKGYIDDSPWFKEYHQMLDDYGRKYGEEFYREGEEFIHYLHRSILLAPSVPDKRSLRGRTRIIGSIDEIGWFNALSSDAIKLNAEEIYTAMSRSFATIKGKHMELRKKGYNFLPVPMFGNISSPSSRYDQIVKLVEDNKNSREVFTRHYSTWEMNPTLPKSSFKKEFNENPEKAMRDYGAVPPLSSFAYISDMDHLSGIINRSQENAFKVKPITAMTPAKLMLRYGSVKFNWSDKEVPKLLALDAGHTNNHFAFAVGHIEEIDAGNDQVMYRPVIDGLGEVIPTKEHPIYFSGVVENIILPIIEEMGVCMIVADRWQNIKLLQDISVATGIEHESHSLKYGSFDAMRQDIYDTNILIPKPEVRSKEATIKMGDEGYPFSFENKPISHFLFQCLTVQDFQGKSVEKGGDSNSKLTDDLFRAVVLAHSYLTDENLREYFQGIIKARNNRHTSMGVYVNIGGYTGGDVAAKYGARVTADRMAMSGPRVLSLKQN